MTENATPEEASGPQRILAIGASVAVVIVACVLLGIWRREAQPPADLLFYYGNTLGTHELSNMNWRSFDEQLARVQLAVIGGALAFFAARIGAKSRIPIAISAATFTAMYADSMTRAAVWVQGKLYVSVCDDALISMRYARNFAEGRGLVYNPGEYVDGFSNPLWTFIMIIPHKLGMHEGVTTIPIVALGGLLLLGAGLLCYALLEDAGVALPLRLAAFFAIVFDGSTFEFAACGLETPLLTFAAPLVVYGARKQKKVLIAIALVMLALARADGAVVAAILSAWLVREDWVTTKDPLKVIVRRWAMPFTALAVAALGLIGWRIAIYGHPAPNTAYLKVFSIGARLKNGFAEYGVRGLVMYGLPTAAVLLWSGKDERLLRARRLAQVVVVVWAYAIYVGGDAFLYCRFLGPVTPLLWTALALAASTRWEAWATKERGIAVALLLLVVPVKTEQGVLGMTWDHAGWVDDCLTASKSIQRNVPPGKTVGTFFAGFAYYAPGRTFVDLLGKTDVHIAHEEKIHGILPGHNKYDFPYAYGERKPDVTYSAMFCDQVERFYRQSPADQAGEQARVPEWGYHAPVDQLMDPDFRALYSPHQVQLKEGDVLRRSHPLGCWFVREGADVPLEWQLARQ